MGSHSNCARVPSRLMYRSSNSLALSQMASSRPAGAPQGQPFSRAGTSSSHATAARADPPPSFADEEPSTASSTQGSQPMPMHTTAPASVCGAAPLQFLTVDCSAGMVVCSHETHPELVKVKLTHSAICQHLADEHGTPKMGPSVSALLRSAIPSLLSFFDSGQIVCCRVCKYVLSGCSVTVRNHTKTCYGFNPDCKTVEEVINNGRGTKTIMYEPTIDLDRLPEASSAMESGAIYTEIRRACPAKGCFAAFSNTDDSERQLYNHLRHQHTSLGGGSFAQHTREAKLVQVLPFSKTQCLRVRVSVLVAEPVLSRLGSDFGAIILREKKSIRFPRSF